MKKSLILGVLFAISMQQAFAQQGLVEKIKANADEKRKYIELINSPDKATRIAAIEEMIRSGDPALKKLALEVGFNSQDSLVVNTAIEAQITSKGFIQLNTFSKEEFPNGKQNFIGRGNFDGEVFATLRIDVSKKNGVISCNIKNKLEDQKNPAYCKVIINNDLVELNFGSGEMDKRGDYFCNAYFRKTDNQKKQFLGTIDCDRQWGGNRSTYQTVGYFSIF